MAGAAASAAQAIKRTLRLSRLGGLKRRRAAAGRRLRRGGPAAARRYAVGRLARAFAPPAGMRFLSGQVKAVIVRRREDSEPAFQAALRSEKWEVVLPELVFEPEE
jgi:hypothetical protein